MWFQSGETGYVAINATTIESRGNCVEKEGDRYLVEHKADNCFRCMVINEKHYNVLQFKETYCMYKDSLDTLCMQIIVDASLVSMFRLDAEPISCPFKGGPPFTFTYNRGSGECKSPVSKADACTDDSRMLLRYQSCPDVHNSESTVEELLCLASWRDGTLKYLVGKLEHKMTSSDEERYRCFVYNRSSLKTYDVAQSADATCNGLPSATEGSRTMRFSNIDIGGYHSGNCRFPPWLTDDHHTWHLLDHSKSYHFSKNGTFRLTSISKEEGTTEVLEMRAVCNSILSSTDTQIMIAAHITVGCQSGYVCMAFYKRNGHVIEMQRSTKEVQNSDEACTTNNFNVQTLPFTTLIAPTLIRHRCPHLGRYIVSSDNDNAWKMAASANQVIDSLPEEKPPACVNGRQILSLGCNSADTMEFHSECNSDVTAAYSCHGDWMDGNGTSFLIALPLNRVPSTMVGSRYCFVIYNVPPPSVIAADSALLSGTKHGISSSRLSSSSAAATQQATSSRHLRVVSLTQSCRRDVLAEPAPQWTFNITHHAECSGVMSTATNYHPFTPKSLLLISIFVTILHLSR